MKSNSHSYGQSMLHVVWSTKYRYNMFSKPKYKNLAGAAVRQAAGRHGLEVEELAVASDHVHVVVSKPMDMSPSKCAKLLKGASSRLILEESEGFRRRYPRGNLWSRGYSCRTVGETDRNTVEKYVKDHKQNQATLSSFS